MRTYSLVVRPLSLAARAMSRLVRSGKLTVSVSRMPVRMSLTGRGFKAASRMVGNPLRWTWRRQHVGVARLRAPSAEDGRGVAAAAERGSNWRGAGPPTFLSHPQPPAGVEGRCGYGGSNIAVSVERNSRGKQQLLEPLALVERRLHPQVRRARENAFCERQDALYIEFVQL